MPVQMAKPVMPARYVLSVRGSHVLNGAFFEAGLSLPPLHRINVRLYVSLLRHVSSCLFATEYVPQATVTSASVVHKPAVVTKPATSTATTVSRGGTPLSASGGGGAIKIASATIYTPPARKEVPYHSVPWYKESGGRNQTNIFTMISNLHNQSRRRP